MLVIFVKYCCRIEQHCSKVDMQITQAGLPIACSPNPFVNLNYWCHSYSKVEQKSLTFLLRLLVCLRHDALTNYFEKAVARMILCPISLFPISVHYYNWHAKSFWIGQFSGSSTLLQYGGKRYKSDQIAQTPGTVLHLAPSHWSWMLKGKNCNLA